MSERVPPESQEAADLLVRFISLGSTDVFESVRRRLIGASAGFADRCGVPQAAWPPIRQVINELITGFLDLTDRSLALCPFHGRSIACDRGEALPLPAPEGAAQAEAAPWWRRHATERANAAPVCAMQRALREGSRIFVWHDRDEATPAEVQELAAELRRRGPNVLLWVTPVRHNDPPGSVGLLETGLLRGFLPLSSAEGAGPSGVDDDWIDLCRNAVALLERMRNGEEVPRVAAPAEPPVAAQAEPPPLPETVLPTPVDNLRLRRVAANFNVLERAEPPGAPADADFEARLSLPERNPFLGWNPGTAWVHRYQVADVALDSRLWCLLDQHGYIDGTNYLFGPEYFENSVIDENRLDRRFQDAHVVIGCNASYINYYHWMAQALPAIDAVLRRCPQERPLPLVLPPLNRWQQDSLAFLGYGDWPRITVEGSHRQFAFGRVEFCDILTGATAFCRSPTVRTTFARLREAAERPVQRSSKLYVARTDAQKRRMLNEEELIRQLAARGYQILATGTMTEQEKMRVFRSAAIVVAPHGAGLTNIIFCDPGTIVYELIPDNYLNAGFTNLACCCDLHYWADAFESCEGDDPPNLRDWRSDTAAVLARVEELERVLDDLRAPAENAALQRPLSAASDMTPVFRVTPRGQLGNRMIEYMVALTFRSLVPACRITGINIPEYDIYNAHVGTAEPVAVEERYQQIDLHGLAARVRSGEIREVLWRGYGQRMENFLPVEAYRSVFATPAHLHGLGYGPAYLVCPVRAADVYSGIAPLYPLTPVEFYRDLVAMTGLRPVFIGQTESNGYTDRLRAAFPDAEFRAPQTDPMVDFETIRQSVHIAVGTSTFVWLASWLSATARTIFMAVSGLFNPLQSPDLDLLPFGDARFRFFLFPINYGVPPEQHAEAHRRIAPYWREVPHDALRETIRQAPRFRPTTEEVQAALDVEYYLRCNRDVANVSTDPDFARAHFRLNGMAEGRSPVEFDPRWYAFAYPMAAFEVGQGDYATLLAHYYAIGRRRGYRPNRNAAAH